MFENMVPISNFQKYQIDVAVEQSSDTGNVITKTWNRHKVHKLGDSSTICLLICILAVVFLKRLFKRKFELSNLQNVTVGSQSI